MQEPQGSPERTLGISFAYWNGFFDAGCYDCFIASTGEHIIEVTETNTHGIYFARLNLLGGKNLTAMTEINFYLKTKQDLDATLPIDPRKAGQSDHDRIVQLEAENAKMRDCMQRVINKALEISENEDYSKDQISIRFALVGMDCIKLLKELDQ